LPLRYWRPSWTAFIDRHTSAADSSHQYYVWRQSVFCRWSWCLERSSRRLARSCTERRPTDILQTVENVLVCLTAAHLMLKVRLIIIIIIIIIRAFTLALWMVHFTLSKEGFEIVKIIMLAYRLCHERRYCRKSNTFYSIFTICTNGSSFDSV